jgi:HEAT repeat protein
MKFFYLLLITFCLVGCKKEIKEIRLDENPYYDRMKKLANEAQANPNDKTALRKLEKYTTDSDEWNRYYAYGYLDMLAVQNVGGFQAELIPYMDTALKNPDQAVRREAASTICDIGAIAVDKTLPTLLNIIQKDQENDDVWFSTKAVGKLENPQKAQSILPVLLKVAGVPPPEETQDEAPQVRYYALDSIIELAKKNNLNAIPDLEKLLSVSKSPYKERVAKAILELNPTNEAAKKVLNSAAVK